MKFTREKVAMVGIMCSLVGLNCMTVVESVKVVEETKQQTLLERDVAYSDGYHTALLDVTQGACDHIEDTATHKSCISRFDQLLSRMAEAGRLTQGVTNE